MASIWRCGHRGMLCLRHCATTNTARPEHGYHYVVAFVVGEAEPGAEPRAPGPVLLQRVRQRQLRRDGEKRG